MRLLVTADLHYNHPKSRPVADELIDRMNVAGGDAVLVVGDTAVADGDSLERCLSRFTCAGPKLIVAGNHELWTKGPDSHALFTEDLPRRVRDLGWHWLEGDPFVAGDVAVVGTVGWYDYSFAPPELGIPRRFYAAKVSPGAADRLGGAFASLLDSTDDILPVARDVVARWNDGKFIKLGRSDEQFLQERLDDLQRSLVMVEGAGTVVAAVHCVPFRQLLPPPHSAQWDFVKAYLGSDRIGQLLLSHGNVKHVYCGHSHLPRETTVGDLRAVNVGSGYRWKTFQTVDLHDGMMSKSDNGGRL
jgi:predicted phosphodiesterase